jgi:formamidopyrimidine-DNA glycosylase
MPELPEVETVRQTLRTLVLTKTIENVEVRWPKIVKHPDDVEEFKLQLNGQTINEIERRGKFLKFILDDYVMVSHLRMEGRYVVTIQTEDYDKHTHVFFTFADGMQLRYRDVRKFGTMHLYPKGQEEKLLPLSQLGVEPFSKRFTSSVLKKAFAKTTRKIKTVLLDQTIVVGLGNIYVDEALFRANIHPERIASSLTHKELINLHQSIIDTLKEAVKQGGSTIRSYVNSQGEMGLFQQQLYVYGKKNEPCNICGNLIQKTVVGGRGTHFCLKCQPEHRS